MTEDEREDALRRIAEKAETLCYLCPANWGDKCPGCHNLAREEKRLQDVRNGK